jgi:UDP-glucose 4-epimerase
MQGKYATVIGIFERQYQAGEPLTVVFPGTQERSFTHIDDVVDGLLLLTKTSGDGYCIGTKEPHQIVEVAKMFTDNIVYLDERKGERHSSSIDLEKMKSLGWEPKIKLPDYIAGVIKGD